MRTRQGTLVRDGRFPKRAGWCATHNDFAWRYSDGSVSCFGATIIETTSSVCRWEPRKLQKPGRER